MESPAGHASGIEESPRIAPDDIPFVSYSSSDRYVRVVGKHEPACGGMCMVPDVGCGDGNMLWVSFSLIFIPTVVWFVGAAPEYWSEVSPLGPIIIVITFIGSNSFLFLARYTEPGLLPTCHKHNPEHDGLSEAALKRVKRHHQVILQGHVFELPELRAKFCRETGNCVEKFDHWCPWVGNAVGARNYRYFVGFVNVTTVHAMLVCYASVHILVQEGGDFANKAGQHPVALILAAYTVVITMMVGGLAAYHWGIILSNTTTNEELKDVWLKKPNPYDQGCYKNIRSALCMPLRASYMREGADEWLVGSVLVDNDIEAPHSTSEAQATF